MAATKRNAMLIEETRDRVRTTQLLNRLHDHALNGLDLSVSQVRAIEILLRKSLPDLSAVTANVHVTTSPAELSDNELATIIAARRSNGAEKPKVLN